MRAWTSRGLLPLLPDDVWGFLESFKSLFKYLYTGVMLDLVPAGAPPERAAGGGHAALPALPVRVQALAPCLGMGPLRASNRGEGHSGLGAGARVRVQAGVGCGGRG